MNESRQCYLDLLVRHNVSRKSTFITSAKLSAGLAAAQLLKRKGHNVLILEGHSRPGGRVYTKKLKVSSSKFFLAHFPRMQAHETI